MGYGSQTDYKNRFILPKTLTKKDFNQRLPMTLKVYVAGKYGHRDNIQEAMDWFKEQKVEITHEWTKIEKHSEEPSQWGPYAVMDTKGVHASDAVVVIMDDPTYAYRGTWFEVGNAVALGKKVIFVERNIPEDAYVKKNIFYHHPHIQKVQTLEEALKLIRS
jgi:nucleoside 2-deoxyribosyltransferase